MVYIGSNFFELVVIIVLMWFGDVLIYCFNGKLNGIVNFMGEVV